jgi:hypothetical protein
MWKTISIPELNAVLVVSVVFAVGQTSDNCSSPKFHFQHSCILHNNASLLSCRVIGMVVSISLLCRDRSPSSHQITK